MTFYWIWTLGLLAISCSGIRLKRNIGWILGLSLIFGLPLLGDFIEPVGHEAEYLRFFQGQTPEMGDTSLYPSMQIWWWLWSFLSGIVKNPLVISCFIGASSVVLFSEILNKLFQLPLWRSILFLGSSALIWSWSLSIYNIIIPFFFVVLSIWYLVFRRSGLIVLGAFGLAVSMRIELIVLLPFLLGWLWKCKGWSWHFLASIIPVISMFSMFGQEIPGEGERWLSLQNNWFLWQYYDPFYWFLPLFLWRLRQRKWDVYFFGSLLFLLVNHIVMASFNDFSSRHLLISLIPITFILVPYLKKGLYWLILLVQGAALFSFWQIFYADQEDFHQFLREEYFDLPHYSLSEARERGCAWVVEMEPFTVKYEKENEERVLSHFNLLNLEEREDLRKQYSCIDWCFTVQDWQWSSLGVRDRAIRLKKLFKLKEISVVQTKELQCLLYSVREK